MRPAKWRRTEIAPSASPAEPAAAPAAFDLPGGDPLADRCAICPMHCILAFVPHGLCAYGTILSICKWCGVVVLLWWAGSVGANVGVALGCHMFVSRVRLMSCAVHPDICLEILHLNRYACAAVDSTPLTHGDLQVARLAPSPRAKALHPRRRFQQEPRRSGRLHHAV